ncbi:MAG: YhcH/YjgK/YiaL family protein [Planctomycetales bacterium]|nr:YhcH/YjgK/YiaL family protein [Planctomycetales bacterium]
MIVDLLENASHYYGLHSQFARAFEFLRRDDLRQLPSGRHSIDGDRLFVIVDHGQGRGREDSILEFHRKYIDIQYVIDGCDQIGWLPIADCQRISQAYDSEKDLGFYFDRPKTWIDLRAGGFAIFYPQDAHAPLGGSGPISKAVLKIAV